MSATLPVQLRHPNTDHPSPGFQKGHPRYGGRRKGSRNRFGGDLREAIVAAIQATGFIEKDENGTLIATGKRGCQGFVEWLALHEPKTAAALFARVLPYFINDVSEVQEVASEAEIEAQFKELGLPLGLIEHLQIAPAPLDVDESDDPYGVAADAAKDDTGSDTAMVQEKVTLRLRYSYSQSRVHTNPPVGSPCWFIKDHRRIRAEVWEESDAKAIVAALEDKPA
jgi:hypothetical protein